MSEQNDDKLLASYLRGDSDLSRQYQSGSALEPPGKLDAAIITAARTAAANPHGRGSRQWYVPLSLAAVVVIGVSIIFKIYDYQGQKSLSESAHNESIDEGMTRKNMQQSAIPEEQTAKPVRTPAPATAMPVLKNDTLPPQASPGVNMPDSGALSAADKDQKARGAEAQSRAVAGGSASSVTEEKEAKKAAVPGAVGGARYSASAWLAEIRQLWEAGKKDEAVARYKEFLAAWPDYPREEMIKQLPHDFNLSLNSTP